MFFFLKNLKQHEQAAPINREMRQLINSLQSHNRQLKTEIMRYKKKVREYQADFDQQKNITEVRKQKEEEAQGKMSSIEKELIMSPQEWWNYYLWKKNTFSSFFMIAKIYIPKILTYTLKTNHVNERTVESLEVQLHKEKEKNAQLESITSNSTHDDAEVDLKKQLAVLELRYHALCTVYCRSVFNFC